MSLYRLLLYKSHDAHFAPFGASYSGTLTLYTIFTLSIYSLFISTSNLTVKCNIDNVKYTVCLRITYGYRLFRDYRDFRMLTNPKIGK